MISKLFNMPTSSEPKEELDKLIVKEKLRVITKKDKTMSSTYIDLVTHREQLNSSPRSVRAHPCSPITSISDDVSEERRSPNSTSPSLLLLSRKATPPICIVPVKENEEENNSTIVGRYSSLKIDHMQAHLDEARFSSHLSSMSILCPSRSRPPIGDLQDSSVADEVNEEFLFSSIFGS